MLFISFFFFVPSILGRYFAYLDWIQTVDPRRLKFLDECHFVAKQLAKGSGRAWSVKGKRAYTRNNALSEPRFVVQMLALFLIVFLFLVPRWHWSLHSIRLKILFSLTIALAIMTKYDFSPQIRVFIAYVLVVFLRGIGVCLWSWRFNCWWYSRFG
jgi:hypothetical protein